MTRQTRTVRIYPELHQRLEAEADARGVSVVWITNRILSEALDDLKPAEEFSLVMRRPG